MNFEQPPQQPKKPENNLDDMLEKAKKESEEKEKPIESGAGGSLDDFLAEIKPEATLSPDVEKKEEVTTQVKKTGADKVIETQQEKNRQAKEKIQPLIDKFEELGREKRSKADYDRGQRIYAALKGDKEEYLKLHDEDINAWLAQCDIYEQALKEYHDAGGEGDLSKEMYTGSTRESVRIFEQSSMGGRNRDEMFKEAQASIAGKYDKQNLYKLPSDVSATTPDEFSLKLQSNAIAEAGYVSNYDKSFGGFKPEKKKEDLKGYFEKRAQGFGIEALNHGDVAVAARSLALAEAVGEIPADLQEKMRASYKKLDGKKKAEFATALDKERKYIKQKLDQAFVSAQNR